MIKSMSPLAFSVVAIFVIAAASISCVENDTATTPASCAFIVGDGEKKRDAQLHDVILPGQQYDRDEGKEDVSYVPCNSRNYIISDGTVRDANGEVVGDRTQPVLATTKGGTPVEVTVTAYWTLNQSRSALNNFYNVCFKYHCASKSDISGEVNNSTAGWNDMLGENFGPALERAVRAAAAEAEESIWDSQNPEQIHVLEDRTSELFGDRIRGTLGYSNDLFCGSGNSGWSDPDKPGKGTFTCSPVRIAVDQVKLQKTQGDDSSEGALILNQKKFKNAQALYGQYAEYWLGLQDTIEKCQSAGVTCIINLGDAPPVVVPTNNVAPEPVPPPTATPEEGG